MSTTGRLPRMNKREGQPGQRLDMLRFQGFRVHLHISQCMQLVGDQGYHPLTLHLGAEAAIPVSLAKLFQLVVQASHSCKELTSVHKNVR